MRERPILFSASVMATIAAMREPRCPQCRSVFVANSSRTNRAARDGAPLYCGRACAGLARRNPPMSDEQRRAEKAAYDREYRARNPEKERAYRQANMARHVEYCRRPEYRAKKHEYDAKRNEAEYGEWAEAWRLLQDLEQEIRSQATAYERRVANGYYTRNAQKRRRELWQQRKTLTSTPAT